MAQLFVIEWQRHTRVRRGDERTTVLVGFYSRGLAGAASAWTRQIVARRLIILGAQTHTLVDVTGLAVTRKQEHAAKTVARSRMPSFSRFKGGRRAEHSLSTSHRLTWQLPALASRVVTMWDVAISPCEAVQQPLYLHFIVLPLCLLCLSPSRH